MPGREAVGGMRIVHEALTERQPVASTSIAVGQAEVVLRPGDPKNGSLLETGIYVANPDNASVTRIDVENRKLWEVRVGAQPRTLAVGPDGNVWVAVEGAGRVVVLDRDGDRVRSIDLGYGSAPYGIAFAPDGSAAYVTLGSTGQLVRLSPAGAKTGRIAVGPHPRGVAVSADSRRVFVTRFVTRFAESDGQGDDDASGQVYEVDASDFTLVRTIDLGFDPGSRRRVERPRCAQLPFPGAHLARRQIGLAAVEERQHRPRRGTRRPGARLRDPDPADRLADRPGDERRGTGQPHRLRRPQPCPGDGVHAARGRLRGRLRRLGRGGGVGRERPGAAGRGVRRPRAAGDGVPAGRPPALRA